MKGVVLAGGVGTRLEPLTRVTNKHLLPVFNEPMLFKALHTLIDAGIVDIQIVLGGNAVGDIVKLIGSGKEFGDEIMVSYVYQDRPGGIAEALALTEGFVDGDRLAVILGDNIFQHNFAEDVKAFESDDYYECNLFLKEVDDPHRFGIVEMDGDRIVSITEKPKNPTSKIAVTGIYFYTGSVFDIIREVAENIGYSARNELEISDVNQWYVERGTVKGIPLEGF